MSCAAVLLASDVLGRRRVRTSSPPRWRVLLIMPASWSAQTLGHATSGTFPAGGAGDDAAGPAAAGGGGAPAAAATRSAATPRPSLRRSSTPQANGGGTIAVSSQSGAAGSLIASGADVAAIGGFSGRESQVSIEWLADAVEQGRIRYVLTEGAQGLGNDSRIGSSQVMAAVEQVGAPTSVDGLYDLNGLADELRAL